MIRLYIFVVFRLSMCSCRLFAMFFNVFFFKFVFSFIVMVCVCHTALKGYLKNWSEVETLHGGTVWWEADADKYS